MKNRSLIQGNPNRLKNNPTFMVGVVLFITVILFVFIYPLFSPYDQFEMNVVNRFTPPNGQYLFGTDDHGRDLLTRICYGTQISMIIGVCVAVVSCLIGTLAGILASYVKPLDQVIMRFCDGLTAIPGILLAMAMMAILGSSVFNLFLTLTLIFIPKVTRIVRSSALVVSGKTYIEALKITGASSARIIFFHIVPNIASIILVQFTSIFTEAVLSEASLSFLGIGVAAPLASLGNLLETGKKFYTKAWWIIVFSGLALIICVWSLGLLTEGLNQMLNTTAKTKKKSKRFFGQKAKESDNNA